MKKIYIVPTLQVDETQIDGLLMVTSISVSNESGREEYVKEQVVDDDDWNVDW